MILINYKLEGLQNRVKTYFLINGPKGLLPEIADELMLIMDVKSVNNFISVSYKPVNSINRIPETLIKSPDTLTKRSTVLFGY